MCNIQDLGLHNGALDGFQLLRFVSSPHPCLQTVDFDNIRGVSNRDLLNFLSEIASTLTSLSIRGSGIPPSSDDEEYAIDAVMPKLVSLESVTVVGDYLSALAIARKPSRRRHSVHYAQHSISISRAPGMSMAGVAKAMEVCCWEIVFITWSYVPDEVMREKAVNTARARGITFNCLW